MFSTARRQFLQQVYSAGLAFSARPLWQPLRRIRALAGDEQTRVYIDSRRTLSPLARNLFGSFLEHLGRAIYEGIYDPGSKLSDANGFRTDVIEEVRKLGVPIIRYPGGNFVSGYKWLDGVGPKQDRPHVLDKAWNSLRQQSIRHQRIYGLGQAVGTQPLLGLNLGTGTPEASRRAGGILQR